MSEAADRDLEVRDGRLRVVLAQCTDQKRGRACEARRLYDESDYFQKQRGYAEAVADEWFIQSAKHGLLEPEAVIEPYDQHASALDDAEAWGEEIARDLAAAVGTDAVVEILGGRAYADPLTPELEARGFEVHEPLRGEALGERKRTLLMMANRDLEGWL